MRIKIIYLLDLTPTRNETDFKVLPDLNRHRETINKK